MFADTLMQLERAYLERLALWGAASMLVGTAVLAVLALRRGRSLLLTQFAVQTTMWGAGVLAFGLVRLRTVALRDLASATQLDRLLWFAAGLDIGIIAVGVVLALASVKFGQRLGPLGASLAVVVQGAALLVAHAQFVSEFRV
jgi:hypothetical protein